VPVTMKDVAKKAKVSTATVSRVLSGKPSRIPISPETTIRVLHVAEVLGYHLDPVARALRTGRTQMLGVIVRDTEDPFFAMIIKAMHHRARERGYEIVLGSVTLEPGRAQTFQQTFGIGMCDGLIIIGHLPGDEEIVANIAADLRYAVGVARLSAHDLFPCIGFDNEKAAMLAMEHLRGLGHSRIGFIGTEQLPSFRERLQVYRAVMERDGLWIKDGYIQSGHTHDAECGYEAMRTLLRLVDPPQAVLACNDLIAIGALAAAGEEHVSIPDTVSVVSFDDIRIACYTCPPLTTVHFPATEMGTRAVDVLMDLLDHGQTAEEATTLMLEPKLMVRGSTAAPAGM
jgi:LacI family repressor for deo operon, udp, cdd, tsx, nupC, and nupG